MICRRRQCFFKQEACFLIFNELFVDILIKRIFFYGTFRSLVSPFLIVHLLSMNLGSQE